MPQQPDAAPSADDADRSKVGDSDRDGALGSRRAVLTATAVAAATAVVANSVTSSGRASAADGDPITAGRRTSSTLPTELFGPSLVVTDGQAAGSLAGRVTSIETGVYGITSGDVRSRAVWGLDQTDGGVGVRGEHWDRTPGTGVFAVSANGPGLVADGTDADVILGGSGELLFAGTRTVTPTGSGIRGTLARDDDGTLWYCSADNRWKPIAGRSRASTFVAIDPTRIYDSRLRRPDPGAVRAGGARVLSVRSGRDLITGEVNDANLVPSDATAISYNLTAARTVGSGFLSIAPGDAGAVKASTLNWTASGQVVANAGIVRVDVNGNVKVSCGGVDGATDFVIDVTGYYD